MLGRLISDSIPAQAGEQIFPRLNTLPEGIYPVLKPGAIPRGDSFLAAAETEAPLMARTLLRLGIVSTTMTPE